MGQAGQPEQAHKKPGRTLVAVIVVALVVVGVVAVLVVAPMGPGDVIVDDYSLLGKLLNGKLPQNARVLMFRAPGPMEMMAPGTQVPAGGPGGHSGASGMDFRKMMEQQDAAMRAAFEEGAGVTIVLVENVAPQMREGGNMYMPVTGAGSPADGYNAVLKNYEGKLDAVVLTSGVPMTMQGQWDLANLCCYKWAKKPLVVADVTIMYDPAVLKQWISTGLLEGVVLIPPPDKPDAAAKIKLITKANPGEIPARAPMQIPTMMPGLRAAPPAGPPAGTAPAEGPEKEKKERKEAPAAE